MTFFKRKLTFLGSADALLQTYTGSHGCTVEKCLCNSSKK